MDLSIIALLIIPLTIDVATIRLSFLSWYERELKYKTSLISAFIISDAASKYIYNFTIFMDIRIQLAIIIGSAILSFILYKRAVE